MSDADIDFSSRKLWWKIYITKKALPTTKCIKLVGKKEFAATALDPEHKIYVVYIGSVSSNVLPSSSLLNVHPSWRPQISGLIAKEGPTKISAMYLDFADVVFPDLTSELSEHTRINNHTIKLVDGCQQPSYGPLYSLKPVELETLKAYIETNLANGFIRLSKLPASTLIVFDQKSDGFL